MENIKAWKKMELNSIYPLKPNENMTFFDECEKIRTTRKAKENLKTIIKQFKDVQQIEFLD